MRNPDEAPRLYSWTVIDPAREPSTAGAVGATDERDRAVGHVCEELRKAPLGARGLIHEVLLSFSGCGYIYESLVARGQVDPISNTIVWETIPALPQDPWELPQQLNHRHPEDARPPEALDVGTSRHIEAKRQQQLVDLRPPAASRTTTGRYL